MNSIVSLSATSYRPRGKLEWSLTVPFSPEKHNSLAYHRAILQAMKELVRDVKDPKKHQGLACVELIFKIRDYWNGNATLTVSEEEFFSYAAVDPDLANDIFSYTRSFFCGENRICLWSDAETPGGTWPILQLAFHHKERIKDYISYLRLNDLEGEAHQFADVELIIDRHGYCPETMQLLVARGVSCAGQSGDQQIYMHGKQKALCEYLSNPEKRKLFVEMVKEEFEQCEQFGYIHHSLTLPREDFLEDISVFVDNFASVLSEIEIKGIYSHLEKRWKLYQKCEI